MNKNVKIINDMLTGAIIAVLTGFTIIALVAFFNQPVRAENSIGLAAGPTKGAGPTFRHLSDESPWGWQATALPVVMPDGGVANAGFSMLYVLHKGSVGLAHLSLGAAGGVSWNVCDDNESQFECQETVDWIGAVGPGVGFELRLVDNFAWSGEFVLPVVFDNGEFQGLYPIPNSSLVYYW